MKKEKNLLSATEISDFSVNLGALKNAMDINSRHKVD